jgi:hypothetical protein
MTLLTRDDIYQPLRGNETENMFLHLVERRVESTDPNQHLNLYPEYQRGHVWTDRQASLFVGSMLGGNPGIPPIWVRRWPTGHRNFQPDEVIDGKQRITAIIRWMRGEIPGIIPERDLTFYARDLEPTHFRRLTGIGGPTFIIKYLEGYSDAEIMQIYLRLNRGGTVHTDEEIARVEELLKNANNKR